MANPTRLLTRRALRTVQPGGRALYSFTLTASEVLQVADISRISRDEDGDLIGYQRPEVRKHIDDIRDYLDGDDVTFPNPIIMALGSDVRFRRSRGSNVCDGYAEAGTIEIPWVSNGQRKPGWIVDGQQRAVALSQTRHQDLPVPVNAFISDSVDVQREQFLRINNTRPLPRGLVTELLPTVSTPLSRKLSLRKAPSALCDLLNRQEDSPFYGLIHRPSGERSATAVVADTSVINMIDESLGSYAGCLFPYRDPTTKETDYDSAWTALTLYWNEVRSVFPEAWGRPATCSRLMHGAGIRAMGRLMDRILAGLNVHDAHSASVVHDALVAISVHCHWTDGEWEEFGLAWDHVQNVPAHISMLSGFLVRAYARAQGALQ
jgi:DGQHR domain-containing protein